MKKKLQTCKYSYSSIQNIHNNKEKKKKKFVT